MFKRRYVAIVASMLLLGCGGSASDRPQVAPVSGRLVKDGKPVAEARIEFTPDNGAASSATTDPDGNFELVYVDGTRGAKIGTHQVRVTIGGQAMASADGDSTPPKKPPMPAVLYIIPTPQTVSEGKNMLELTLPAKGQQG